MQLLKTIMSCLQIDDWQKSYMSATNTEKPKVSKWRSRIDVRQGSEQPVKPAEEHEVRVREIMKV